MVFNRFGIMLERLNWTLFYSTTDDLVLENIIDEAIDLSKIAKFSFFLIFILEVKFFLINFLEKTTFYGLIKYPN